MHTTHTLHPEDRAPLATMRALTANTKGMWGRPESRASFDELLTRTPPAPGVVYEEGRVGDIPGWWCIPAEARPGAALLHLHGGGFVVGSAKAHRYFAGQIAAHAHVRSFVPDYRLAPEHRFPAALDDAQRTYAALAEDHASVILVGDSAGGGLALSLLGARPHRAPRAAVALSPWTDLALTGESLRTRADADPYITSEGLAASAGRYLGSHDPRDPRASPLHGDLSGLPPVLIHVGDDEILLDDSLRYAARHANCSVHVWTGMPHVFPANVGLLRASELALQDIGTFVSAHL